MCSRCGDSARLHEREDDVLKYYHIKRCVPTYISKDFHKDYIREGNRGYIVEDINVITQINII